VHGLNTIRKECYNTIKKNGERDFTKEVNSTSSKCGGYWLGCFVAKNITNEKVQAEILQKGMWMMVRVMKVWIK
jgi:hypothetical protein